MENLDDLLPGTMEHQLLRPQDVSDGGHYYGADLSILAVDKHIKVYIGDYDREFYVQVDETVALPARPSSTRTKNRRKRQLTRTVWAAVASIDCYYRIEDAVHDMATKLHEKYFERYKTELKEPLEYIIASALREIGRAHV